MSHTITHRVDIDYQGATYCVAFYRQQVLWVVRDTAGSNRLIWHIDWRYKRRFGPILSNVVRLAEQKAGGA